MDPFFACRNLKPFATKSLVPLRPAPTRPLWKENAARPASTVSARGAWATACPSVCACLLLCLLTRRWPGPHTCELDVREGAGRLTPKRLALTVRTDQESERPWSSGSCPVTRVRKWTQ